MKKETLFMRRFCEHNGTDFSYQKHGITSTDIAAVCNIPCFTTKGQIWAKKCLNWKTDVTERMKIGALIEDFIADLFTMEYGIKLAKVNYVLQDETHDRFLANIDRRVVGAPATAEIKNAGAFTRNSWFGKDNEPIIPLCYVYQTMWEIMVTKAEYGYIIALIGGNELIVRQVFPDPVIIAQMRECADIYWRECIEVNKAPIMVAGDMDLLDYMHGDGLNCEIELPSEFYDIIQNIEQLKEQKSILSKSVRELEVKIKDNEALLKQGMGQNEIATIADKTITWQKDVSSKFDRKKFEKEYPELAKEFIKEEVKNEFKIKELKI